MEAKHFPLILRGVVPTSNGTALFFTGAQKTFAIYVDPGVGHTINTVIAGKKNSRTTAHELIGGILDGFEISPSKIVVHNVENGVFFAKIFFVMRNEIGAKILEIDARPSDALLLALQKKTPLFVTQNVLDRVEDMTHILKKIIKPNA